MPPITDWSNIETVIVTARPPGPALWHVVRGNSEVWILATVSPVPKDLNWDSRGIASLLKGSNALLLPPRAQVGLAEGLWFYMWHMDTLEQPDGMTLEASLARAAEEPLRRGAQPRAPGCRPLRQISSGDRGADAGIRFLEGQRISA